jgi:two-component system, NtrC family, sensor histidine kinase PilS
VRLVSRGTEPALKLILDPRRLIRWVFIGRLCLASAIFIAAVSTWSATDASKTLLASLVFAVATGVTVVSAVYSEVYRKRLGPAFLYLQAIFDLLLVTAIVHVTNGSSSPFAALYILVVAAASLLLPASGGLFIAALGIVFYFGDVVMLPGRAALDPGVWLQLGVIAVVALVIRYLSAELRESGEGAGQLVAALQQSRLQAEDILRNIRSGVITVDVEGCLLYANPMAEHLLGVDLVGRIGEPVLNHIATVSPELAEAIRRAAVSAIRTTRGEAIVSSVAARFSMGVTTTYTEHDETGARRTATAIFQDISDQKRMDALRLRAQRLEGVAELSASLAHEIRNPLASIRSAVEQISRMPATSDDQKTLSALVMRESDRLSRLLGEFLDFARVRVTRLQQVNLSTLARDVTALVAAHPDRSEHVRVTCVVPDGDIVHIEGDEDLLQRAMFNLALNAVQATPDEGAVRIELLRGAAEPLPSGLAFEGEAVSLRVSDNGPGIPNEIRDRMFDPFFTTKPNGTGLGLAVVHRAIEAHRGHIFVDSSRAGTQFTVVLPRGRKSTPATPATSQPATSPELEPTTQGAQRA